MFSAVEAREGLASGRFAAIQTYNGDYAQAQRKLPGLEFFVPGEGSAVNADYFLVGHDAEHPELAHAFINFMLDPKVAAMNMEDVLFYMPNSEALSMLGDSLRNSPAFSVPKDVLEKSSILHVLDDDMELYDEAWEEVLFG